MCNTAHVPVTLNTTVIEGRVLVSEGPPHHHVDYSGHWVVGAIAATIAWFQGRSRHADLGFVSHQWVAEHRLFQMQDLQR